MTEEYLDLKVKVRSKATFGTDVCDLRVWRGQSIKQEAERMAASWGATVDEVKNLDGGLYTGSDVYGQDELDKEAQRFNQWSEELLGLMGGSMQRVQLEQKSNGMPVFNIEGDATEQEKKLLEQVNKILDQAVEDGLNQACLTIQKALGISSGDNAGMYFSDPSVQHGLASDIAQYMQNEMILMARQREYEKDQG